MTESLVNIEDFGGVMCLGDARRKLLDLQQDRARELKGLGHNEGDLETRKGIYDKYRPLIRRAQELVEDYLA